MTWNLSVVYQLIADDNRRRIWLHMHSCVFCFLHMDRLLKPKEQRFKNSPTFCSCYPSFPSMEIYVYFLKLESRMPLRIYRCNWYEEIMGECLYKYSLRNEIKQGIWITRLKHMSIQSRFLPSTQENRLKKQPTSLTRLIAQIAHDVTLTTCKIC